MNYQNKEKVKDLLSKIEAEEKTLQLLESKNISMEVWVDGKGTVLRLEAEMKRVRGENEVKGEEDQRAAIMRRAKDGLVRYHKGKLKEYREEIEKL